MKIKSNSLFHHPIRHLWRKSQLMKRLLVYFLIQINPACESKHSLKCLKLSQAEFMYTIMQNRAWKNHLVCNHSQINGMQIYLWASNKRRWSQLIQYSWRCNKCIHSISNHRWCSFHTSFRGLNKNIERITRKMLLKRKKYLTEVEIESI